MVANNFGFMPSMFSTQYELIWFIILINLLFCNDLLGPLIIDQLFFDQ